MICGEISTGESGKQGFEGERTFSVYGKWWASLGVKDDNEFPQGSKDLLIRMQIPVRERLKSDLNARNSSQDTVRYLNKAV